MTLFLFLDPNTQILYACDSCGDKFLDATSLAQHVRIHTAQALVMFQADSDFYQYTTAAAAEGDAAPPWQPAAEHVIQEGELIFRGQDGVEAREEGMMGDSQGGEAEEVAGEGVMVEEQVESSKQQTDKKCDGADAEVCIC